MTKEFNCNFTFIAGYFKNHFGRTTNLSTIPLWVDHLVVTRSLDWRGVFLQNGQQLKVRWRRRKWNQYPRPQQFDSSFSFHRLNHPQKRIISRSGIKAEMWLKKKNFLIEKIHIVNLCLFAKGTHFGGHDSRLLLHDGVLWNFSARNLLWGIIISNSLISSGVTTINSMISCWTFRFMVFTIIKQNSIH